MATTTPAHKLEDQAANAALYAHNPSLNTKGSGHPLLDEDGKLSSAGAAMSLKYAKAKDLPSFPSAGLKLSSAGAAASLADSNKHTFEHWKPGSIPAANKAAMLAKDYEMDPLWQPEMSAAGSRAALIASKDPKVIEPYSFAGTKEGQSAAGQALKQKTTTKYTDRDVPADAHRKALMAATGAMAGSRQRAGSAPLKPVSDNSWALKAATHSHKDTAISQPFASGNPGFEAARIQNAAKNNVNRQLYGSAPPVGIEVQEKNRQATLRASAIAMAQKMYAIQQSHINDAAGGRRSDSHTAANSSHRRKLSEDSDVVDEDTPVAHRYENLEEAARKLAQERLAKLRDEHAEYRQYYGASPPQQRSRMSTRLSRQRASTGTGDDSDEEQSRNIRQQMSMFQAKLTEVDRTKRQADRDALLEAAHRNVEARMAKMDKDVFQETGKASPAQREAWEKEARLRADARAEEASQYVGKVHIGGGKYLDQSEVDAIARARLQPTLDDITEKAEKQRARDEEIRVEQERAKAQALKEKASQAEAKAELKQAQDREKQEMRAKREEEKRVQREQAAASKEARRSEAALEKERVRLEKEEKRKSKDIKPGRFSGMLRRGSVGNDAAPTATSVPPAVTETATSGVGATAEATEATEAAEGVEATEATEATVGNETTAITATTTSATTTTTTQESGTVHDIVTMPTLVSEQRKSIEVLPQPDGNLVPTVAGFTQTATPLEKSTAPIETPSVPLEKPSAPLEKQETKKKSWFKFKTLRGPGRPQKAELLTSTSNDSGKAREGSIRDVAMAGRTQESEDLYGSTTGPVTAVHDNTIADAAQRSPSISSLSSSDDEEEVRRGRRSVEKTETGQGIKHRLFKTMRPAGESATGSKADYTNTSDEEFEEARDTFEEKQSAAAAAAAATGTTEQPRTSHGESKFTEVL